MSTYRSYSYSLERERRRELAAQVARDTTRPFVETYHRVLVDTSAPEILQYVSREHAQLRGEVARLEALIVSDPFEARDLSRSIASQIHGLRGLAAARRATRIEAERAAEQLRIETLRQARAELESAWQDELSSWSDSDERAGATAALLELRKRLMSPDASTTPEMLRQAIRRVRKRQEHADRERQLAAEQRAEREALQVELQTCRDRLAKMPQRNSEQVASLAAILEHADTLPPSELGERLRQFEQNADRVELDEACRREVLQKVSRALQEAGFVVQGPQWSTDKQEVVVRANRPAGAQAECRVALDGGLRFKFDRYKGSACKADVDKVLPRLQKIYGIRLSDERVMWENPDDEDADARSIPPTTRDMK